MGWGRHGGARTAAGAAGAAVLAAGVLLAPPAAAIDNWGPPEVVGPAGDYTRLGDVAVSGDGTKGLALWVTGTRVWAAWRDQGWQAPAQLGFGVEAANLDLGMSADGATAVAVWDSYEDEFWQVYTSRWTGSGWTPAQKLGDPAVEQRESDVAVSADGSVVMASYLSQGQVLVSRLQGGTWVPMTGPESATTDSARCYRESHIALSDDGSSAIVSCVGPRPRCDQGDRGRLAAASWDATQWSPLNWARSEPCAYNSAMALTGSGNSAYLVYTEDLSGAPTPQGTDDEYRVSLTEWRAGRWRTPRVLGQGASQSHPGAQVSASPHGSQVAVAWLRWDDPRSRMRAAAAIRSEGRWQRARDFGAANADGGISVGTAGGESSAVWLGGGRNEGPVMSSTWAGRSWSAPKRVGGYRQAYTGIGLALTGDGSGGLAVWRPGDGLVSSTLQRTARAAAVKVRIGKAGGGKARARITWTAPDYALFHKIRVIRSGAKAGPWQKVAKPKHVEKLRKNRSYRATIRVYTRAGGGPTTTVRFRT